MMSEDAKANLRLITAAHVAAREDQEKRETRLTDIHRPDGGLANREWLHWFHRKHGGSVRPSFW